MPQSGFVAAMLLAAFILWLAVNDRLSAYTAVLWGDTAKPTPTGNLGTPSGMIGPGVTSGGAAGGSPLPELPGGGGLPSLPGAGGGIGNLLESFGPELLMAL